MHPEMRKAIHVAADDMEESAVKLSSNTSLAYTKSWIEYNPIQKQSFEIVGVDSSFNKPKVAGFMIGAVSCIATNVEAFEYFCKHKIIENGDDLSEVSRNFEANSICNVAPMKDVDLLIVDGSIFSFLTNAQLSETIASVLQELKNHKVVFSPFS